jgi:DNA-binding transcriptional ArsR family regulator
MQLSEAARAMDALGHDIRLSLYRTLVRAGRGGLAIGTIQTRLGGVPRSTLAHHLGKLVDAGLVVQRKEHSSVISTVEFDRMDALDDSLTAECCVEVSAAPDEAVSAGADAAP